MLSFIIQLFLALLLNLVKSALIYTAAYLNGYQL